MNSYEEFLQAIDELYDQNKLDFNNYKLLKKELESIENEHEKQQSEYRNYFKMLESKINNIVVSGGGLTEDEVLQNYNHEQTINRVTTLNFPKLDDSYEVASPPITDGSGEMSKGGIDSE